MTIAAAISRVVFGVPPLAATCRAGTLGPMICGLVRPRRWRGLAAVVLAVAVAVSPIAAQTDPTRTSGRRSGSPTGLNAGPPLREAVRRAALNHDALTQSTTPRRGSRCAVRIPLLAAAGAAVFAATAVGLLAAGGGSDAARRVIVNWALLGAAAGGIAGLATCR